MKDLETVAHMERLEELGTWLRGALMVGSSWLRTRLPKGLYSCCTVPKSRRFKEGKMSVQHNSSHSGL